jgi:hypothetical protein
MYICWPSQLTVLQSTHERLHLRQGKQAPFQPWWNLVPAAVEAPVGSAAAPQVWRRDGSIPEREGGDRGE